MSSNNEFIQDDIAKIHEIVETFFQRLESGGGIFVII